MFDLRYHVASLAAVFLALIIGILVGVGISDRGLVDSAKTKFLQDQVASLQHRLDNQATQSADLTRERAAAQSFINETYPALARNRLQGKQIAVVFVGSDEGRHPPLFGQQCAQRCRGGAAATAGAERADRREAAGRGAQGPAGRGAGCAARPIAKRSAARSARSWSLGGDTPLWDSLTDATSLVEHRLGGNEMPADGVVVVRTASPQHGATSKFLLGLYEGLGSTSAPAVGRRARPTRDASATSIFRAAASRPWTTWTRRSAGSRSLLLLAGAAGGPVRREGLGDRRRVAAAASRPAAAGG